MDTIGLVVNLNKKDIVFLVDSIIEWLEARGCKVILPESTAMTLGRSAIGRPQERFVIESDCVMVLGGDGTLLSSARQVAATGTPIFGVNLGHLGFLTEIDIPELTIKLDKLLQGNFYIEERMMLEARVVRQGRVVDHSIGLNDAVIAKGGFARLIKLETYVNDEYVSTYPADGIIVASPTGSTAYSLSAGGPFVTPELELMLVTPICPHSLRVRPLVISGNSRVKINVKSPAGQAMLTMDGQHGCGLEENDLVLVNKAPYRARFLRLKEHSFFYVLRQKLSEGDYHA